MARNGVLMEGGRFGSSEFARPMVRDPLMFGNLGCAPTRAALPGRRFAEPTDEHVVRNAGKIFSGPLCPKPEGKREFTRKAELALKAACAQYLGHYPSHTPCKSEIKLILREMERMHGDWRKGFEMMEMAFGDMERTISGIARYARKNEILPLERQ